MSSTGAIVSLVLWSWACYAFGAFHETHPIFTRLLRRINRRLGRAAGQCLDSNTIPHRHGLHLWTQDSGGDGQAWTDGQTEGESNAHL